MNEFHDKSFIKIVIWTTVNVTLYAVNEWLFWDGLQWLLVAKVRPCMVKPCHWPAVYSFRCHMLCKITFFFSLGRVEVNVTAVTPLYPPLPMTASNHGKESLVGLFSVECGYAGNYDLEDIALVINNLDQQRPVCLAFVCVCVTVCVYANRSEYFLYRTQSVTSGGVGRRRWAL